VWQVVLLTLILLRKAGAVVAAVDITQAEWRDRWAILKVQLLVVLVTTQLETKVERATRLQELAETTRPVEQVKLYLAQQVRSEAVVLVVLTALWADLILLVVPA